MKYSTEEQLKIVAEMEEISPVGARIREASDHTEEELDMETLSLVTAARGGSYENFLKKAPEAKVQEEKEKQARYQEMMEQVEKQLEALA